MGWETRDTSSRGGVGRGSKRNRNGNTRESISKGLKQSEGGLAGPEGEDGRRKGPEG